MNSPKFFIKNIPCYDRLILAPMDGISDSPFRSITRKLGSGLSYTEFINGLDVIHPVPNLANRCKFTEEERPVFFQLFDEDPERIIQSAKILYEKYQPDAFDVNMGCSVRRVSNRGAGAGLLLRPDKIKRIVSGLVNTVTVPVTIKIRLGWDNLHINYLEIGKIAQEEGASLIALHARTREQKFSGKADWDAIASLKQSVSIPVLGNGDIANYHEALTRINYTKCDGVLIGRNAVINPWLFSGYDSISEVPFQLYKNTICTHLEKIKTFYGPDHGCVVFRKFAKRYLNGISDNKAEILELMTTEDPDLFTERFKRIIYESEILNKENH